MLTSKGRLTNVSIARYEDWHKKANFVYVSVPSSKQTLLKKQKNTFVDSFP